MLRDHATGFRSLLLTVDMVLAAVIYLVLASRLVGPDGTSLGAEHGMLALGLASCLAWPLTLQALNLYTTLRRSSLARVVTRLFGAGLLIATLLGMLAFSFSLAVPASFPLVCAGAQLAGLAALRLGLFGALRVFRRSGRNTRNLIVIGSGARARDLFEVVGAHPAWGQRILAFADDSDVPEDDGVPAHLMRKLIEFPEVLRSEVVDEVIFACSLDMLSQLDGVVAECVRVGVPVTVPTDLFGTHLPAPRIEYLGGRSALSFAPVHHSRTQLGIKRGLDILGASLGLLLCAPFFLAGALAMRLSSPGPVLFRQVRCGLNRRPFEMLKLRTMVADAESRMKDVVHLNEMDGPVFKMRDDPRITPVGRLLRRTSIDELPQLWNVLRGDMSLVGPRPPVPHEVAQYESAEIRRLSMRPGLTCLWQVSGRNEVSFEEWVRLDLKYIDRWSLGLDVLVLLRTVPAVLTGRGAS